MKHLPNKLLLLAMVVLVAVSLTAKPSIARSDSGIPAQWSVKSLYFDPIGKRWQNEVQWTYRLASDGGGFTVTVVDDDRRMGQSAQMTFNSDFLLTQVTRDNRMGNRSFRQQRAFESKKPVIIEDAMAPCNWPNRREPWQVVASQTYEITEAVSDKERFNTTIEVTSTSIPVADALAQAMISKQTAAYLSSRQLTLITATKLIPGRAGQTILTQLWAADHFFWLFEQTPARKSYYVFSADD